MKYNLKKTKTAYAETLRHLMTVLHIIFSNADDMQKKKNYGLAEKRLDEAELYLKGYIKELFNQNK